jgi:prophage antirepressor-like protein
MATTLIDTIRKLLVFEGTEIYIAFKSTETDPYFYGKQVCKILDYHNTRQAISHNVSESNKFYLKDIVTNYKTLYKNVQGHTVFINEIGLYQLINKSKSKKAEAIRNWIESEVLPSLRKHGEYRLKEVDQIEKEKLAKELKEAREQLKQKDNEIGYLKNNLKEPKIKKGHLVYIIREVSDTINFERNEILKLKLGKTKDLKTRKKTIDTSLSNRSQILKSVNVDDKDAIEACWKNKMRKYVIIADKEYYECSYDQMIEQLAICIKFFEGHDVDTKPDKDMEQSRENSFDEPFDTTKVMKIYFEENDFDSDVDPESSDDDMETSDDFSDDEYQSGGGENKSYLDRIGRLKYKLKYLTLLDELR